MPRLLLILALVAFAPLAAAQDQAPVPEQPGSTIGYPNVAAALRALKARGDVDISDHDGWTMVSDKAAATIWSFPPATDPAYPSAVKRELLQQPDGAFAIRMNILCEASKAACDDLVKKFQALNDQIKQAVAKKAADTP